MSVIIRLQNLPWSANALDIRQYFRGLSIPEGGVHIVGGEQGDAFIAFSTDEDARQAMLADGGKIKEIKIKLLLSSRAEMQKVIELARQQSVGMASYIPLSIISGQNTNSTSNQALPVNANTTGPIVSGTSSPHDPSSLTEKKDNDSISNSSGRDRRKRSRSRDRKERHRDRDRDRDRDRERRRRERSRSRDRSRRGRRERTRSRDRSKSRDKEHQITNRDKERRNSREAKKQDSKENGSSNINNTTNWNMNNGPNLQPSSNNNGFNQPPQQSIMPQSSSIVQGSNLPSQMMGSIGRGRGMPLSGSNVPPPLPPIGGPGSLNETINQNQFMRNGPWSNRGGGHSSEMGRGSGFTPRNGVFGMLGQDGPPEMDQGGGMRGNFRSNFRGRGGFGPGPRGPMMDNDNFNDRRGGGPYRGDRDMDGTFPGRDRFEQFPNRNMNNQYSGFRGENRYSDLGYDPRNPNPGTCIKISNMPPEASYSDVRRFFHGHFIANNGLKLINDNFGKRTGVAYVRFGRPEAKEVALKMGGKPVRGCPVEILHIDDEVFDKAIDSFRPANPCDSDPEPERENIDLDTDCVVLTEIPSFTKELDVFKIFNELNILEILMTHNPNKQFVAYIRFHSKDEAKIALNKNSNLMIAHKQVKIAPLNLDKFLDAKKIKDEIVDKNEIIDLENINSSDLSQIQSECVLLQKLPLQVNERDIRDFFSDIGLVPARIHILSLQNKSFAEAFCEFSNLDEGKQALSKNNLPLGKQEVAVKSISRGDMMEALGMPIQNAPDMSGNGGFGLRGPMGRGGFMNNRGGGNIMQPRMPMMGRFGNQTMGNDGPPIEGFGQPGCVVALDNIPFRSEIEEILQFFHNFDVTRDQIIRRFNDKGWATGEARVALSSPQEVDRALHELRGEKMRGRQIFLTRV